MKKTLLIAMTVLGTFVAKAQDSKYGITTGLSNVNQISKVNGTDTEIKELGYFIGFTYSYYINTSIDVQASAIYSAYTSEGANETSDMLQIPILAKYYIADYFNLQGGPQINYLLKETSEDMTKLGIGLNLGAGYDITKHVSANLNYQLQLNNSYTGDADINVKTNFINAGLTYYF